MTGNRKARPGATPAPGLRRTRGPREIPHAERINDDLGRLIRLLAELFKRDRRPHDGKPPA